MHRLVLVCVLGCVDQTPEPIITSGVVTIDIPIARNSLSQASPCLPMLADADPETPGAQDDCAFAFEWAGGGRTLAPCKGDGNACWQLVVEPISCIGEGERALQIVNPPTDLPTELHLRGQCVVR